MKQFIVYLSEKPDRICKVVGMYDRFGHDTDDPSKAETFVYEDEVHCHRTLPYDGLGIHPLQ